MCDSCSGFWKKINKIVTFKNKSINDRTFSWLQFKFRNLPDWIEINLNQAIIFNMPKETFNEWLNFETSNLDNYTKNIARERLLEIKLCEEYWIPYFFMSSNVDLTKKLFKLFNFKTEESTLSINPDNNVDIESNWSWKSKEINFSGTTYELFDKNFNIINTFPSEISKVCVRSNAKSDLQDVKYISGNFNIEVMNSVEVMNKITNWIKYVSPEYIKRKTKAFKYSDFYPVNKDWTIDEMASMKDVMEVNRKLLWDLQNKEWKVFIKTTKKGVSWIVDLNWEFSCPYQLLWYGAESQSLWTEMIWSVPMRIAADNLWKIEWRCYCINWVPDSISRNIDKKDGWYDQEVWKIFNNFVDDHKWIFWEKASYVVDFARTDDIWIALIEMNHYEWAWRYEQNIADSFVIRTNTDGKYWLPLNN